MNNLVARQKPEEPFIFLPKQEPEEPFIFLPEKESNPQFIPMPYPVPMGGNQDNNQGGFNFGRALGSIAGSLGMGFGDPALSPGLAGRYGDLLAEGPSFEIPQGQGRNPDYSIYNDPRMPGARKLRRKLEGILGLPRINFPQAQGLPYALPGQPVQGPTRGPSTPIQMYPGMGYGPVGPSGGGARQGPTPIASLYRGPQFGQA